MKPFGLAILFVLCILTQNALAQYLVSGYKPKNETEKIIITKIKALPEIREWFETAKKAKPDLLINVPDSPSEDYSVQVGLNNMDTFRTNYYLFINPRTFRIYFLDNLDESLGKSITLKQWRRWRSNPGFRELHKWVNGKLVVLKNQ